MEYRLGSEDRKAVESKGIRAGQRTARATPMAPAGVCHAVDDNGVALCGVRPQHVWPQPWIQGFVDRCSECTTLAAAPIG